MSPPPSTKRASRWFAPLAILGFAAAVCFCGLFLLDWMRFTPAHGDKAGPLFQFFNFDPDTAQNALGNLAQVIAAVLGIVITVVSIVVQLAATRYTPRIADMFFRDRTNLAVLGFFVVAGIDAVWVSLSVTHEFVPRLSILGSLVIVSASLLIMVPYFAYVFDFLDPEKIVARIQEHALASALRPQMDETGDAGEAQAKVVASIEQLADVAMNAISQKDKLIAQGAVDALKELAVCYLGGKQQSQTAWFKVGSRLRQNPDFVSLARESLDDLTARRVWMEWKVLRQFQALYAEALGTAPDMNYLIALDTRYIGDAALEIGDSEALQLVVKFFNTYLRATLNAEEVRTAYNVLNQYRQLCENVLSATPDNKPDNKTDNSTGNTTGKKPLAVEIAGYFRYYGQTAHGMRLGFIAETVAYDLASICEHAFNCRSACHDELLKLLLTVDQSAETDQQELILRGVRKAQVKLATFYLQAGAEAHARTIAADMRDEGPARLKLIHDELAAVRTRDFWEVIDRGSNFDYIDEKRREKLEVFFGWFPGLAQLQSPVVVNGG